jgi:hypothetical protein
MTVDGDGSEGIGSDVDVDESKQNMVFGDECKDGTGIGNTRYNGTDVQLKAWASTVKFILSLWSINRYA